MQKIRQEKTKKKNTIVRNVNAEGFNYCWWSVFLVSCCRVVMEEMDGVGKVCKQSSFKDWSAIPYDCILCSYDCQTLGFSFGTVLFTIFFIIFYVFIFFSVGPALPSCSQLLCALIYYCTCQHTYLYIDAHKRKHVWLECVYIYIYIFS